ncbi:FtsX-like permease family protein [Rhodocytophaga aerolata]|uniref:FtsX-like permease family protein n=1 Tax=Rhodocytophaga aerolata TaxID=455078 RepID=A0ABT8R3I2_9BACT|nr:FtsX-like permease family protein [Rhodocytophaga aerolata]MDO1446494.1 FtsX-like permease family protein [Rhodocytophaga aerolata]
MLAIQLAIKNLLGAGLRTWLNVAVLSFAFVVIVFYNGMLDGWNRQALKDTREWEVGNGQLWHPAYDRYDPFSLQEAHAPLSGEVVSLVQRKQLTPVLITQASAYPKGRMINIVLKGIDPDQQMLKLPTSLLKEDSGEIPALIGKRMAQSARLKTGDKVLVRWRDKNGTFDAREIHIAGVFDANVPSVDNGQFWIPLGNLQQMTGMENEATLLVAANTHTVQKTGIWEARDLDFLLKEFNEIMDSKKGSSKVIYFLLLAIALLAIFDTQVLSVFRRQKEIGTYIALGMTRAEVVRIFTVEGSAHSFLALLLGALYGIPFLAYLAKTGIPMPKSAGEAGIAISDSIIPVYSAGMVVTTILLVVITATVVSYFPARRISSMKPTEALKGKIQ